jgi:hypothetical protein
MSVPLVDTRGSVKTKSRLWDGRDSKKPAEEPAAGKIACPTKNVEMNLDTAR